MLVIMMTVLLGLSGGCASSRHKAPCREYPPVLPSDPRLTLEVMQSSGNPAQGIPFDVKLRKDESYLIVELSVGGPGYFTNERGLVTIPIARKTKAVTCDFGDCNFYFDVESIVTNTTMTLTLDRTDSGKWTLFPAEHSATP
jgi:hypothetical protein